MRWSGAYPRGLFCACRFRTGRPGPRFAKLFLIAPYWFSALTAAPTTGPLRAIAGEGGGAVYGCQSNVGVPRLGIPPAANAPFLIIFRSLPTPFDAPHPLFSAAHPLLTPLTPLFYGPPHPLYISVQWQYNCFHLRYAPSCWRKKVRYFQKNRANADERRDLGTQPTHCPLKKVKPGYVPRLMIHLTLIPLTKSKTQN